MMGGLFFRALSVLGAVGAAACFFLDRGHFHANVLLWFSIFFTLGWGAVFLLGLERVVNARWSVPFRRITERLALLGFVSVPLQLMILADLDSYFVWARKGVEHHPFVEKKIHYYLNAPFFSARSLFMIVSFVLCYRLLVTESLRQDADGDPSRSLRARKFAPAALALFALSMTIFSFDYISSLMPIWYSDIIGVYFFAGSFLLTLSAVAFVTAMLKRGGELKEIREKNVYNLGALIFAFTVFWSYICFAQYMLMWYANIPEEVFFYKDRAEHGWQVFWVLIAVTHVAVPFFALLTRGNKSSLGVLMPVACVYFAAHYLDLYLYVFPVFFKAATFTIHELSFAALFAGISVLSMKKALGSSALMPGKDPLLGEALA